MMKKTIFLLIFASICIISACSKKSEGFTYEQSEDDYYTYEINEPIIYFDIADDDRIYYLTEVEKPRYETHVDDTGEEYQVLVPETLLKVLDSRGDLEKAYIIPDITSQFCFDNERIIYTCNSIDKIIINEYNITTQTSNKLCEVTDYNINFSNIQLIADKLFFIGINKNYTNKNYSLASSDDKYTYSGEKIGYYDLPTSTLDELSVDFPISFSSTLDNSLLIYAYDEDKGYHFIEYDISNKTYSNKIYHNLEMMSNFTVFNNKNDFLYRKLNFTYSLTAASIAPDKGDVELIPKFTGGFLMKCNGEYTFFTDLSNEKLIRIKNNSYIRKNKKLTMLSSVNYKDFTPFGCGYTIQHNNLTDEEMALSLLSLDDEFDISCMNSRQVISSNVRDKGSFYPLNEVKSVKE